MWCIFLIKFPANILVQFQQMRFRMNLGHPPSTLMKKIKKNYDENEKTIKSHQLEGSLCLNFKNLETLIFFAFVFCFFWRTMWVYNAILRVKFTDIIRVAPHWFDCQTLFVDNLKFFFNFFTLRCSAFR